MYGFCMIFETTLDTGLVRVKEDSFSTCGSLDLVLDTAVQEFLEGPDTGLVRVKEDSFSLQAFP